MRVWPKNVIKSFNPILHGGWGSNWPPLIDYLMPILRWCPECADFSWVQKWKKYTYLIRVWPKNIIKRFNPILHGGIKLTPLIDYLMPILKWCPVCADFHDFVPFNIRKVLVRPILGFLFEISKKHFVAHLRAKMTHKILVEVSLWIW